MVKEVNSINAVGRPGGVAAQESIKVNEVDLTGPANVDRVGVLFPVRTGLFASGFVGGGLLGIKINCDTSLVTVKFLSRPESCQESTILERKSRLTKQACCRRKSTLLPAHRWRP
jgi:hypothetical protein